MKVLVLNEDLGIPTDEPFEVLRTASFFVLDIGEPVGEIMVSEDDVEIMETDKEDSAA